MDSQDSQEMDKERIFISLSPEVRKLLDDNDTNLVRELQREGLDVERVHDAPPSAAPDGEVRTKDLALIILASAAATGVLGVTITQIIDAVSRRPALVTEKECVPVCSPDGEIVRDADGNPVLQWVEKHKLLEPQRAIQGRSAVSATLGNKLIDISLSSGGGEPEASE